MEVAKHSDVVLIISNSEKEWVERSCRKYLPITFEAIQDIRMKNRDKLQIFSAKHIFQKAFPLQPAVWKKLAFKWFGEKFGFHQSRISKNVIVVGDREFEICAGEELARAYENCLVKTIKYPSRKESVVTPINLATRTKFLLSNFKTLVRSKKPCKWRINSNNKLLSSEECVIGSETQLKAKQDRQSPQNKTHHDKSTRAGESGHGTWNFNAQDDSPSGCYAIQCSAKLKSD